MKLPRIVENAFMAALNGAAVLAIVMLIAWLLWLIFHYPEEWFMVIASVSFGLGFIAAFVILAIVQSIPDEDD